MSKRTTDGPNKRLDKYPARYGVPGESGAAPASQRASKYARRSASVTSWVAGNKEVPRSST